MMDLSNLHDATLKSLCLDWGAASIRLTFKTGTSDTDFTAIEAEGVTFLACPRHLPWGPSNSVNEASVERGPNDQVARIEMQSGDLIEIGCRSLKVVECPDG